MGKNTYIFYFSAILFGIVHITNYKLSYTILLLSPILIAPQILVVLLVFLEFVMGLFGVFCFMRFTMLYCRYRHPFYVSAFGNNKYRNPFYSIKIEETNDFHDSVLLKITLTALPTKTLILKLRYPIYS
jgi:hypothetical protein